LDEAQVSGGAVGFHSAFCSHDLDSSHRRRQVRIADYP
jgi:hypothetical protein